MKSITKVLLAVSLCALWGIRSFAGEPANIALSIQNNTTSEIAIESTTGFNLDVSGGSSKEQNFTVSPGSEAIVSFSDTSMLLTFTPSQVTFNNTDFNNSLAEAYTLTFTLGSDDEVLATLEEGEPILETFSSLEEAAQNFQEIIRDYLLEKSLASHDVVEDVAQRLAEQYLILLKNNSILSLKDFLTKSVETFCKNAKNINRDLNQEMINSVGLVKSITTVFQHLRSLVGGAEFTKESFKQYKRHHMLDETARNEEVIKIVSRRMQYDYLKGEMINDIFVNFSQSLQVLDPSFDLNAVIAEVVDEYVATSALAAQVQGAEQPLATILKLVNQEYVQKKADNDFVLLVAENLVPIVFTIKQVFSDFISQFSSFFAHKAVQTTLDLQNLEYQLGLDVLYEQLEQDMQESAEKVAIISQVKDTVMQALQEYELVKKELQEADAHLLFHLHTLKLELPQTVDDFNFDPALQQGDAEYEAVEAFLLRLQEQIDTLFSVFS